MLHQFFPSSEIFLCWLLKHGNSFQVISKLSLRINKEKFLA